jgi:hypothetical protein
MEEENYCQNVSSRGILKSCKIHSKRPVSSTRTLFGYGEELLQPGPPRTLYICSTALPLFAVFVSNIPYNFVLVTGDADESVPTELFTQEKFIQFINNPKLIHWFSQNCNLFHEKITPIPIGLDYHTLTQEQPYILGPIGTPLQQEKQLLEIKRQAKPFYQRKPLCYSNFHFFMTSKFGYDRVQAKQDIPEELVFYEPEKQPRFQTWKNQSEYAFVISPLGHGMDCHRTWEALALGCIPIVKTSLLDRLYEHLPVLIVHNWCDVTEDLLKKTLETFQNKDFKYEKLSLAYWKRMIESRIFYNITNG